MRFKRLAMVGLIGFASALTMAASGGCSSDLRKADQSAGVIAASLHTAATANHASTLETPEERVLIANLIVQAASANDQFIGVLKDAEKNGGKVDKGATLTAFDQLTARIDQLNDLGVLHLKSPQAQVTFAGVIASIRTEIAFIRGLSAFVSTNADNHGAPRQRRQWPPLMAITLTATEIEELIALAIAAGSTLLPKLLALRGKTNAEILADAEADDAAAIAQAEADGADAPKL